MQIIHVYNNNIVSAIRGKQEMIIVGAGIGFHKRPGDTVDEKRIEKTDYPDTHGSSDEAAKSV